MNNRITRLMMGSSGSSHSNGGKSRIHRLMHRDMGGSTSEGNMPSNIHNFGEGEGNENKLSHGGRPKRTRRDMGGAVAPQRDVRTLNAKGFKKGGHCYADGGDMEGEPEPDEVKKLGMRKGGHAKRRHRFEGGNLKKQDEDRLMERKKGGRMKREHHDEGGGIGDMIGSLAPLAMQLLPMILKKGGHVKKKSRHLRRAMGGAGKTRLGMMDSKGDQSDGGVD